MSTNLLVADIEGRLMPSSAILTLVLSLKSAAGTVICVLLHSSFVAGEGPTQQQHDVT